MLALLNINNLKIYLIVIAAGIAIWFYKDWQYQKEENKRQTANIENIRKMDSLKFASQTYTKKELEQYIEYNRADLKDFLKENDVRYRRIEKIITQTLKYCDTSRNSIDLSPILNAIKDNKQNAIVPVIDSTDCLIVKGYVVLENDSLVLNITDRNFRNKSDVISYWERNQWNFLGINTRFLGHKQTTVIIKDSCGNTETFVINAKKKD